MTALMAKRRQSVGLLLAVVALGSVVLSAPVATAGATTTTTSAPTSCTSTAQTQLALDQCAARQLTRAQRQLAAALTSQGRIFGSRSVRSTQAKWVAFEKAECALEAAPDKGGSIVPLVVTTCETRLTTDRLADVTQVIASREEKAAPPSQ
jgi:uncharacterized protein YecT (DUF1311 family)